MNQLEAESIGYDIICVSETWLNKDIKNDTVHISGYHDPVRKDDGYGGVAIYVKEELLLKIRQDLMLPDLEAVWV